MASCEFPVGIARVSGTLAKTTIRTSSGTITRRVVACMRNGKQKIYFREDKPRSTQVTQKELKIRSSFAIIASEVSRRMAAGDKRPRKVIWAEVKTAFRSSPSGVGQGSFRGSSEVDAVQKF